MRRSARVSLPVGRQRVAFAACRRWAAEPGRVPVLRGRRMSADEAHRVAQGKPILAVAHRASEGKASFNA